MAKKKTPGLTAKRKMFINEYLKCWNASEAARRAGYAEKSAYGAGYLLLRNREIREVIESRLSEKAMSADEVLARLGEQARATHAPFIRVNGDGFIEFDFSHPEAQDHLHLIKKIHTKRKRLMDGDGKDALEWEHEWIEVELHDSQAALALLARHFKLLTDKIDLTSAGKKIGVDEETVDRAVSTLADALRESLSGKD